MRFIIAFPHKGMTFQTHVKHKHGECNRTHDIPITILPTPSVRPSTTRQRNFAPQRTINVMRGGTKDEREWPPRKNDGKCLFDICIYLYMATQKARCSSLFWGVSFTHVSSFQKYMTFASEPCPYNRVQKVWGVLPGFLSRETTRPSNIRHHGTTSAM